MGELVRLSARYGLRYNYISLLYAIFSTQTLTPDQALHEIYGDIKRDKSTKPRESKYTTEIIEQMETMKRSGMTWKQVGEVFGLTGDAAYHVLKWYRERREEVIV